MAVPWSSMRGKHRRYWKKPRRGLQAGGLRAMQVPLVTVWKDLWANPWYSGQAGSTWRLWKRQVWGLPVTWWGRELWMGDTSWGGLPRCHHGAGNPAQVTSRSFSWFTQNLRTGGGRNPQALWQARISKATGRRCCWWVSPENGHWRMCTKGTKRGSSPNCTKIQSDLMRGTYLD